MARVSKRVTTIKLDFLRTSNNAGMQNAGILDGARFQTRDHNQVGFSKNQ
jgi:hypothetical protein